MRVVLLWQIVATVALGVLAGMFWGGHGAASAVLGGVINQVADWSYARLVSGGRIRTAGATLRVLFRAEAARIILIVFLMGWVLASYPDVLHAAFFASFAVSVLVFRMAILVKEQVPGISRDG